MTLQPQWTQSCVRMMIFDDVDEDCDYYVDDTSYEAGMNIDALLKSSNYFLFVSKLKSQLRQKKPGLPASQERARHPKQRLLCPDSSPLDRGHLQNGVHETFSHPAQKDNGPSPWLSSKRLEYLNDVTLADEDTQSNTCFRFLLMLRVS